MQLILSIDDIGIKKNMSSGDETNQSEKKIKTEIIDSNLTSSPSPSNVTEVDPDKHDQIEDSSQLNVPNETNGIASCNDASVDDDNSSKTGDSFELKNPENLIPENEEEDHDIHTNKTKTETGDNILPEECSDDFQEEKTSSNDICEENCDKIINSDTKLCVKSEELHEKECQNENVSNINENEKESMLENDKIKQETGEYEKICKELEADTSIVDGLKISEEEQQHSDENSKENQLNEVNGIDDNKSSCDENNIVEEKQISDNDTDVIDNIISDNFENCQIKNSKSSQHTTDKTATDNCTTCSVSDEVIDIVDIRDSPDDIANEDKDNSIEDKPTQINEGDIKNQNVNDDQYKEKRPITIDEDIIDIADEKDSLDSITDNAHQEYNILRSKLESNRSDKPVYTKSENIDAKNDVSEPQHYNERSNKIIECSDSKLNKLESTDKVSSYKLSNTLDILSDEEEESIVTKPNSPKPKQKSETNDKQCINIEEDDDIMVIDDESSAKDVKITTEEKKTDELIIPKKDSENIKDILFETQQSTDKDSEKSRKTNEANTEISKTEITKSSFPRSPLLSSTTLKSFKKNLAEMTREELEDFCILTIAEAVFDRTNLGELKSQMKILTQNFEEHKLKAKNLAKQNRDLQVVLKSIQEEQKKNSDAPITPLKITRSVGMQVLMTDKVSRKRQAMLTGQTLPNSSPTKQITPTASKLQNKPATSTNISNAKTPPRQSQQQIPVPRLVPAVNPVTKPSPNSSPQVNNVKSPVNVPNGVKTAPSVAKPEKRTHTKMQQSSAVTVDLTDDEPPAKVVTRNFNSPVRCVPPQSLLAPRPSLPMTSPRKVYIPISGQQAQNIRPGQHIMLKSVTGVTGTPGRPRGPSPNMKVGSNTPAIIRPRIAQRHPAPLPEVMKQYQPPNWKALPPAPELKLAKVENGIVISWKIDGYREENHEEIASYQLFAYQETSQPPNTSLWKKIGDVKALPLPMACTLTQFMSGYKYYFAVRAVDVKSRFGPFSLPGSILLLKN